MSRHNADDGRDTGCDGGGVALPWCQVLADLAVCRLQTWGRICFAMMWMGVKRACLDIHYAALRWTLAGSLSLQAALSSSRPSAVLYGLTLAAVLLSEVAGESPFLIHIGIAIAVADAELQFSACSALFAARISDPQLRWVRHV